MNAFSNLLHLTDPAVSLTQERAVSVQALTLGYGGREGDSDGLVVSDLSFDVKSGERFAIIGPNGAGKSTLIKGMLGLLRPVRGKAVFLDRPFRAVRQHVAYVAQADDIDWRFPSRVRDLVAMGRAVHLGLTGRLASADWAQVHSAMERLNISDLADRPLTDLSGGQRRRVLLARALAQDPQILVLDEPFQAIDQSTKKALVAALDQFQSQGKTALIVHHNLADVQDLFDRVALINGGESCVGRVADVLTSPAFYQAFGEHPPLAA